MIVNPPSDVVLFELQFANRQGSYFNGCGGIGSWDVTDIEFKNTKNLKQGLCISHMLFLN